MQELPPPQQEKELSTLNGKLVRAPILWKKYAKTTKWLALGFILIFIIFLSASTLLLQLQKSTTTQPAQLSISTVPTITSTSSDPTENWKTYRDEKNGFEFKYPENIFWQAKVLMSKIDPASPSAKCSEEKYANFETKRVFVAGNYYCLHKTEEGAAGTAIFEYNYSIIKEDTNYTLHLVIMYPSCGNFSDEVRALECEESHKNVPIITEKVLSTFKFIRKNKNSNQNLSAIPIHFISIQP